ncbi:MAG TPA: hypothetical protein VLY85_01505 [Thermoplasmata archaeon]|nr:hypothetical protein [Thermoplasmata archaeon]
MRELTVAEYRTILSILAHPTASERDRIRLSRLPSSTYNVVRKRVFDEGWLSDSLVPNPGPCGFSGVELLLSRPSLSSRELLVQSWGGDPECVLLWAGVHAVFGIFFRGRTRAPARGPGSEGPEAAVFRVFVGRRGGVIPAYFDYSGLWARFGRQPPPPSYPSGLDPESDPAERRGLAAAQVLVRAGAGAAPVTPRWINLLRLPRSPRRALERGIVQSRTILNLFHLPPFEGRRIGELVLIQGRLRDGSTAHGPLGALVSQCAVYPFLVAEAEGNLLLAGVGQTRSVGPGRVLVPAARRPVLKTLGEHLDPANVLIEPVEAVEEPIGHRYPRAIPALASPDGVPRR